MNIHEYQAKELLKKFGIPVPNGVVAFSIDEVLQKIKLIKTTKYVLKAQIHAGGRGKAGGIKILDNVDDLEKESSNLFVVLFAKFSNLLIINLLIIPLNIKKIKNIPIPINI